MARLGYIDRATRRRDAVIGNCLDDGIILSVIELLQEHQTRTERLVRHSSIYAMDSRK